MFWKNKIFFIIQTICYISHKLPLELFKNEFLGTSAITFPN